MSEFLFFSRQFIRSLPEDPLAAILAIIGEFRLRFGDTPALPGERVRRDEQLYQIAQEACAVLASYLKREGFAITVPQLKHKYDELDGEQRKKALIEVGRFMDELQATIGAQKRMDHFDRLLQEAYHLVSDAPCYEFSNQELNLIRTTLDKIQELLRAGTTLNPDPIGRLVKRIDTLQAEFRTTTCDLARFWGFIMEASLALRSGADEVRSVSDEVDKLLRLVWSVQTRAFGLPPDTPLPRLGRGA